MSMNVKKIVMLGVMTLVSAVISLPVVSYSATVPAVSLLSPLVQGLRAPVKMALDATGNIYVADQRVNGIVRYNAYGVQLQTIQTVGAPSGLAFAQDGTLLVGHSTFVARYNVADGLEVGRLSGGQLLSTAGIAVDDVTGYVYVTDARANQVAVYTASGSFVKSFAAGQLASPSGITFEKVSRQLAVADTFNNRIQFFDVDGVFVKSVGTVAAKSATAIVAGTVGQMKFDAPTAVAFDYANGVLSRMYVVDSFQANIQVVDPAGLTGSFLTYIGSPGTANGQLMVPSDAVFDAANNRLLVVNGYGNVTIFGIDGGKNPIYVDVTAPVFTINQLPVEVTVNALTISGTVEVGSTVQVVAGGGAFVGPVSYSGSSWSALITNLTLGVNSFTATAKDVAGNTASPQVASVNYLLSAPAVTVSPVSSVTKSATMTISGTVDAGSSVKVTNLTTSVNKDAAVVGTVWSSEVNLTDGANNLRISAQKPETTIANVSISVILDTLAPSLSVSALANGSNASDPVQNISGTVTDLNVASVTVNGSTAVLNGNSFSVPVTLLNGPNTITVVAVDAAGNTVVDSRILNYNAGSGLAVLAPVDNLITATAKQEISGTAGGALTITVAGSPVAVSNGAWSTTVNLGDGLNTVNVVATDAAGNTASVKRTITLDASRPYLAVVSPAQDIAVNVPNILISGTVSDSSSLVVEYTVNGTAVAVPVVAGTYSFNVDFAVAGNYPVTISAKDAAGNTSTVVRNVIYDTTPPLLSLNQVNGVMPTKLSGTVEAGSAVVVKDGALSIGSVVISNGTWSADLTGTTYSPDSLLVVASDAAGNSTSKSLVYSFPDGTLNGTSKPTVQDALRAIRIVVNQMNPTSLELSHYDIGPLVGGKPNPNGKIEIVDAILILRKALGLKSW